VRIPNETMVKARVTNYTRHPLRRIDVEFTVVFGTDLERLREALLEVVDANPLCFDEPAPLVQVYAFTEGTVNGRLCVWVLRQNFLAMRTELHLMVSAVFRRERVQVGLPQRVLWQGLPPMPAPGPEGGDAPGLLDAPGRPDAPSASPAPSPPKPSGT